MDSTQVLGTSGRRNIPSKPMQKKPELADILQRAVARWQYEHPSGRSYPAAWLKNVEEMVTEYFARLVDSETFDESRFETDVLKVLRCYADKFAGWPEKNPD